MMPTSVLKLVGLSYGNIIITGTVRERTSERHALRHTHFKQTGVKPNAILG
jgi:hypothetical protein